MWNIWGFPQRSKCSWGGGTATGFFRRAAVPAVLPVHQEMMIPISSWILMKKRRRMRMMMMITRPIAHTQRMQMLSPTSSEAGHGQFAPWSVYAESYRCVERDALTHLAFGIFLRISSLYFIMSLTANVVCSIIIQYSKLISFWSHSLTLSESIM